MFLKEIYKPLESFDSPFEIFTEDNDTDYEHRQEDLPKSNLYLAQIDR